MRRARPWLRSGLLLLTAYHLGLGGWLVLAARSFYDSVPTVALYPPFNQHVFFDFGATNLSLAVVLGGAAVIFERRMVLVALAADLVFGVLHLAFHATHLADFTTIEATVELGALALVVVIPAALMGLVGLLRDDMEV
jgi:hypothetical protein